MARSAMAALLPRQWPEHARTAVLHAVSLASTAATIVRGRWSQRGHRADLDAQDEVALLREELRIKDDRMARLVAARRPHYQPPSRMAILELRARRGWSLQGSGPAIPGRAEDRGLLDETLGR